VDTKVRDLAALHPCGEPPVGVVLPAAPAYSAESFTVDDLRKAVRAAMTDSSPGPDGWTFEALHDALEHDLFATNFHAIVCDICNGRVAPRTARLLAASSLIGIPKGKTAADGTRPIALGATFLKVAAARALRAANASLTTRFAQTQYGCAVKGGAEFVVHAVRRFVRDAKWPDGSHVANHGAHRVIATIDFANAFNTPTRQAMWEATRGIQELAGIFSVSYAAPSDLHIVGCGRTLLSERGARQGTVDGPVTFALTLQAVLNAASACAGARVLAYLDDVTILAENPAAAERTVTTIIDAARALEMEVKTAKCEFLPVDGTPALQGSKLACFRLVDTMKLLGASIARSDADEAAHLLARESGKATLSLERLRKSASPQFFTLLRQCVIPKLAYATRTHCAGVSRKLCQGFDARVEDLLAYWSSVSSFTHGQRLIMGLPRDMGGMGLTRTELIAPAAYHASLSAALSGGAQRIHDQATLCGIVYRDALARTASDDAELRRHLHVYSLEGSDAALCCLESRVHPDVFGAVLRTHLRADAFTVAATSLPCRGCGASFSVGGEGGQHVSCCVVARGGHVTRRHNAVVARVRRALAEAGLQPDATEPRDMARYSCRCGGVFTHGDYLGHRSVCGSASRPLHVSGPDIRYRANGVVYVADVTVVNLLTATHAAESASDAFAAATKTKEQRYGALCAAAGARLVTLPATANGHLGQQLVKLANTASDLSFRERRPLREELSATIAHISGVARLAAEERAGVRPPSIELEQVKLQERFRLAPLPPQLDDGAAAQATAPFIGSRPAAFQSLCERIACGVLDVVRRDLELQAPRLVREALDMQRQARREAEAAAAQLARTHARRERRMQRRAAGGGRYEPCECDDASGSSDDDAVEVDNCTSNTEADAPAPPSAPRLFVAENAEAAEFRTAVAENSRLDDIVARASAQRAASEAAVANQVAVARARVGELRRETTARLSQLGAHTMAAARVEQLARAESVSLDRARAETEASAAEAVRLLRDVQQRAAAEGARSAELLAQATKSLEESEARAAAAQAALLQQRRSVSQAMAAAEESRQRDADSAARAISAAEEHAASVSRACGEAAQQERRRTSQSRRASLAAAQREWMSLGREATQLGRSSTSHVTWSDDDAASSPVALAPPPRPPQQYGCPTTSFAASVSSQRHGSLSVASPAPCQPPAPRPHHFGQAHCAAHLGPPTDDVQSCGSRSSCVTFDPRSDRISVGPPQSATKQRATPDNASMSSSSASTQSRHDGRPGESGCTSARASGQQQRQQPQQSRQPQQRQQPPPQQQQQQPQQQQQLQQQQQPVPVPRVAERLRAAVEQHQQRGRSSAVDLYPREAGSGCQLKNSKADLLIAESPSPVTVRARAQSRARSDSPPPRPRAAAVPRADDSPQADVEYWDEIERAAMRRH
jgi:hypothetical protein